MKSIYASMVNKKKTMDMRSVALSMSLSVVVSASACFVCKASDMPKYVYDAEAMFDSSKSTIEQYGADDLFWLAVDHYLEQNPDVDIDPEIDLDYDAVDALSTYKKAQTLSGVCYDVDQNIYGTFTLKIGAIAKQSNSVKIKATISPLVGKKVSATVTSHPAEDGSLYGNLRFKSQMGVVSILVYGHYDDNEKVVLGCVGESERGYFLYDAKLGGAFETDMLYFSAECDADFGEGQEPIIDFPDGEPIYVKNGVKFGFDSAPSIKYKKVREDGETWYELVGLDDDDRTNYSDLKLTYTAKTGLFKGSFKIYLTNECCIDGKPKLKTVTAKVNGIVIDGEGYGAATFKIGKKSQVANCWIVE